MHKNELSIVAQVAQGNVLIPSIARALHLHVSQVYRTVRKMGDLLEVQRGKIEVKKQTFLNLLLRALAVYPNLAIPFSDSGLEILSSLLEPKKVSEITLMTGFKRSTIYGKIKEGYTISLIRKQDAKYVFNQKIWPQLSDLLEEFRRYTRVVDSRVPAGSVIYYKTATEIVFSVRQEVKASFTAFSAYEQFGIKILTPTNYYYLPFKKSLSLRTVFMHSLYIADVEKEYRLRLYVILFYLKYRRKLGLITHPLLDKMKEILSGKQYTDYPILAEIKEKAEIYDINI